MVVRDLTRPASPVWRAFCQGVTDGDGVQRAFAGGGAGPLRGSFTSSSFYSVPLRQPRHLRERENKRKPVGQAFESSDGVCDRATDSRMPASPSVTFGSRKGASGEPTPSFIGTGPKGRQCPSDGPQRARRPLGYIPGCKRISLNNFGIVVATTGPDFSLPWKQGEAR